MHYTVFFFYACMETTGIMPGIDNLNIASCRNLNRKTKFLEPGMVSLVLHSGYMHKDTQDIALCWLKFLDICHFGGQLEYVGKNSGEHTSEMPQLRKTGNSPTQTSPLSSTVESGTNAPSATRSTKSLVTGRMMGNLHANTMSRRGHLRQAGYKVESTFEWEYHKKLAEREMAETYATYVVEDMVEVRDPLDPRIALFRGRVNSYRMLFKSFDHQ